jgi:polyisoprenoid-binding protein YceI
MNIKTMKITFALLILFGFYSNILAVEYNVDVSKKNSVKFISDAPIEEFEGISSNIDGYLIGGKNDIAKDSELYFEIDLNTVDTGISLRNRHMRDNYLHTKKFPLAAYTGKIISAQKNGGNWNVVVEGEMDIHGKSKKISLDGKITKSGNSFRITSKFFVNINDHGIPVPKLMAKKINPNMQIVLDFYIKSVD